MSKKTNRAVNFAEFNSGETDAYEPPKYLVKPQPNDTGFFMFKKEFDNQKSYFQPKIASNNPEIPTNESNENLDNDDDLDNDDLDNDDDDLDNDDLDNDDDDNDDDDD
jgi:hypothetical protein